MKTRQNGFALVAAIALIVVLAALIGFVATVVSTQTANQSLEYLSRVTNMAAQAGLEWGAWQVMRNPPPPAAAPNCPAATALTLPGSLASYPVSVNCTRTNSSGTFVYMITATATHSSLNNPDYVERTKTAVFSR